MEALAGLYLLPDNSEVDSRYSVESRMVHLYTAVFPICSRGWFRGLAAISSAP